MQFSQVFEPFYRVINGVHCVVFPVPFVPRQLWETHKCESIQEAKMHLWSCVEDYQAGKLEWQQDSKTKRFALVG